MLTSHDYQIETEFLTLLKEPSMISSPIFPFNPLICAPDFCFTYAQSHTVPNVYLLV